MREDGPSSRASPATDEGRSRKKKGRPPKTVVVDDYEPSVNGKRKRGSKAASVTPSIADDDDDGRDSVRSFIFPRRCG